ncbi:hypothetical protein SH661x_001730 [Planctomicrobium sp. SH661]|uniref:hypothetical protein n=1 Tax=Planctomicrobium sp. SH661 TaxID=3448124 RepID=UPI003F5BBC6E
MPDLKSGTPAEVWGKFFAEHRPAPRLVSEWVSKLHQEKQYPQVIACLQAALVNGQAQPWMYEVLALNMEIENYPKEAVERVVLSLTDFGDVDFGSMMYSGAYLTRFGRKNAALTMYRQAARLLPERSEPYVLGLKLAKDVGSPDDVEWAATGILLNYWKPDFAKLHKSAETALLDQIQIANRSQNTPLAERLQASLREARSRDLTIRLEWNGNADLDMQVEEPTGTVCSCDVKETQGGGLFLNDGVGPNAANSYELYVCPRGAAGPYRVRIRNSDGTLVGNRATLTATLREGMPDQSRVVRTLILDGDEVSVTIELPQGRRTQPRIITTLPAEALLQLEAVVQNQNNDPAASRDPRKSEVMQQFRESRDRMQPPGRAGAVGYAPVVQVIPQGTTMSAQGVVSPDRRYVRLGIQPAVTEITDVFTFTYLNGGNR